MVERDEGAIGSASTTSDAPLELPEDAMIPKIIHQTFPTKHLPQALADNVEQIQKRNSGYEHILYDDAAVEAFIRRAYGKDILGIFNRIDRSYGAARADLFRYLVIYELGGIYLDIKSSTSGSVSEFLRGDDEYLLSKWRNGIGEVHERAGMSGPMRKIPGGEFQQWHIVAVAKHPFLAAVIEKVLDNITSYNPWINGTGRRAVIRLSGPIAYTEAIEPIRNGHKHRQVRSEADLGLVYTVMDGTIAHRGMFSTHYSTNTHPLVVSSGVSKCAGGVYSVTKRLSLPLIERAEAAAKRIMFG